MGIIISYVWDMLLAEMRLLQGGGVTITGDEQEGPADGNRLNSGLEGRGPRRTAKPKYNNIDQSSSFEIGPIRNLHRMDI